MNEARNDLVSPSAHGYAVPDGCYAPTGEFARHTVVWFRLAHHVHAQYLVNQPIDPNAGSYYTPYMAPGHAQGQPHHAPPNNMAAVPLYNDRDEKIPEYSGPTSDTYLPHEKERFEDIKV